MKLFAYGYDEIDGNLVRVRREELPVWCLVNTDTGEVDLGEVHQFEDDLFKLASGYEWRKFNLKPNNNMSGA